MAIWHDVLARLDHPDVWGPGGLFPLEEFRRTRTGYTARCPNPGHPDRHPSFSMQRRKPFGRCFSCGYRRGWIGYTMEQHGASADARGEPFWRAVRALADRAGVSIPERGGGKTPARPPTDPATACRAAAASYLRTALQGSSENAVRTREYLRARGLDSSHLPLFPLGVIDSQTSLAGALRAAGCGPKAIHETGLFERYMARHCLIFIYGDGREVTGFKGRVPDRAVKDVKNAKGFGGELEARSFFGLDLADEAIATSGRVILVEGEFDCLSVQSALSLAKGVTAELVALGGTAKPTREKFRTLARLGAEIVYLAFDADPAGQRATAQALSLAWAEGLDALVLPMPDGIKDPDEALQRLGLDRCLEDLFNLERAVPGGRWLAEHLVREARDGHEGRLRLRRQTIEVGRSVPGAELKLFLDLVARALAEPVERLEGEIRAAARAAREARLRERLAAWAREFQGRVAREPALPEAIREAQHTLAALAAEIEQPASQEAS